MAHRMLSCDTRGHTCSGVVAVGLTLGSETVLSVFCTPAFKVCPLVSQDHIRSAIGQWKRRIRAVIQENGGPIQHRFQ
jgi:hypothetical protein